MNILYYVNVFPKISQSFILNEIYALEQAGHNVAVFAEGRGSNPSAHPEYLELESPIKYGGRLGYNDILSLLSNNVVDFPKILRQISVERSLQEVATLTRTKQCIEFVKELEWDIDIIHTHFATRAKSACRNVALYFDVPFTLTAHAFDIYKDADNIAEQLLNSADRIVTISEYNRSYIQQEFGTNTPIDIVRAGIRPEKFTATGSTSPNQILTVARHQKKKGLHDALEAVALAARKLPDLKYHLIGSGPLSDELVDHTKRLDIEDHVSFLNNVPDDRLTEEYDRARCFLLPCVITKSGQRDGIPVALMEAMAMETPPISTPISGIPELIDHEQNGLLGQPRNPESIAQELIRLMQNDSMWGKFCQQGRRKVVKEFNIMKEIHELEQTFEAAQRDQRTKTRDGDIPPAE